MRPEWMTISDEDLPLEISGEKSEPYDLDEQWKLFAPFVHPFESDRSVYKTAKYTKPVFVDFHPALWRRLVKSTAVRLALDFVMELGFVPASDDDVEAWLDPTRRTSVRFRYVIHEVGTKQVTFDASVVSENVGPERVRQLEAEVKELTRQLRYFRQSEAAPGPIVNPSIVNSKPVTASISGGSLISLQFNILDADSSPFVVSIGALTGRMLMPCTIFDHKYIMFAAPQHPRGSVAVTVLCTSLNGNLRRYAKSVWMEYRSLESATQLSHHAVNQLLHDLPLPSSTTGLDPSENAENKSEAMSMVDDNEDTVSDNLSVAAGQPEPHLPLTREMLDMLVGRIPPVYATLVPPSGSRRLGTSECSETMQTVAASGD